MAERLLMTGEVARLFGVTHETVRRWVKAGRLSASRTSGGQFRYAVGEVRALAEQAGYSLDRFDAFVLR